jgi:hypothetical protein
MRNTLIGKTLLLHIIMAIIQTPPVGNQSAYPKILPLSNILMVLINQQCISHYICNFLVYI